ncbi:MAG: carbohydrate ABC transporter permease [Chloroflexi bacterium]|nr:carbohydrate ABC transporter permease [Chloroflexota bacterium]
MGGIRRKVLSAGFTAIAILILFVLLYPLVWIISSSVRPYSTLYTTETRIIPAQATLDAFRWVFLESKFWLYAKNSLIVYAITLVSSLVVTVPAAYGFSRFKFYGKESLLYSYFVLAQFMSGMSVVGLIGLYLLLVRLGLIDSLAVVGLIYAASNVPFVTWYLKTYFDSLPRDFDEAAFLDGASFIQNLRYVIVPIARPGILVAIIFISIFTWSEWVIAGTLLGPEHFTLPVGLVTLQVRWETPWNRFAAMSLIYSLPMILLFVLSHQQMEAGMTLGGMKG